LRLQSPDAPASDLTIMRIDRRDVPWLIALVASLILGVAVSWQRWGSVLVDCGREMNQPLRLLDGERLYAGVAHIYGPLAPYLNAALYGLFGPSLGVLDGHGLVATFLILALSYWLARQLVGRAAATLSVFAITWLCALKPSGNYILPYAYGALDACLLALASLALAVRALKTGRMWPLTAASVAAGLAVLAKTEMGFAALLSVAVAGLVGSSSARDRARRLAVGVLPGLAVVVAVYGLLSLQVGWSTLICDGHLIPLHLPEPLLYYNRRMFGFDAPLRSLAQMLALGARIGLFAAALVWLALARRGLGPPYDERQRHARRRAAWVTGGLLVAVVLSGPAASWDKGPFLVVPLLLLGMLIHGLVRLRHHARRPSARSQGMLVVYSVFALAMLARTLLRVRSGGAYSSYLLPVAVILFVVAWVRLLPLAVPGAAGRRATRRMALGLLYAWMIATAAVTFYRWQHHFTFELTTPRGTMRVLPDEGVAFAQAMEFIQQHTSKGDPVLVMPEGTSLLFFTGRRNPLPEEITTPGLLDEPRAIRRLKEERVPLVLVTNRPTEEFGAAVLGRDYHVDLMRAVHARYTPCGLFGRDVPPDAEIGNRRFFIRAYCLKTDAAKAEGATSPAAPS